ncbi:MAG: SDR family oxidoreductase [Pirellulaceae bacterium]|nr:SDR family oxidoreductase [Pirellulaceae bacterium]
MNAQRNQDRPRVAVVTGSSSGIGRATALRLAEDGCALVLHARKNIAGVQATATEILKQFGRRSLCVLSNVADARARGDLVRAAFAWSGHVDVWINNAGADVLTTEARGWSFDDKLQYLLATDLQGTMGLSREVAARMATQTSENKPTIINIGWDQALLGMSGDSGQLFCTTKAAVMAFTNSLAMSVAPQIRVNCVAPGWIKTAWGNESSEYWDNRARDESLLARWGAAGDVANTIGWLASPAAEFVNGQCINVNGGRRFAE